MQLEAEHWEDNKEQVQINSVIKTNDLLEQLLDLLTQRQRNHTFYWTKRKISKDQNQQRN